MAKTIAVFGAGPGLGRSIARRFGREGFRVALVARTQTRLDTFAKELGGQGIEAVGFAADLAESRVLPSVVEAITARFGAVDVLHYAPAGVDWLLSSQTDVRQAGSQSFELPLNLLLRTPADLVQQVLPGMIERDEGAVLFALAVSASTPYPPMGNIATAAAAGRAYLENLHAGLAGTGVYAGLLQVGGMVGDSDAAQYAKQNWEPSRLPNPLDPAALADVVWDLYAKRDRFEEIVR
jgi:NADP-dependent 3-hydroxy acid dehydrogenase YdfG